MPAKGITPFSDIESRSSCTITVHVKIECNYPEMLEFLAEKGEGFYYVEVDFDDPCYVVHCSDQKTALMVKLNFA